MMLCIEIITSLIKHKLSATCVIGLARYQEFQRQRPNIQYQKLYQ
jgi:hypothetical protein